mgnify:CR=1 FL=1
MNPQSNVYLASPPGDRDAWIYLDTADTNSNWGIYHRQIDGAVKLWMQQNGTTVAGKNR